MPVRVYKTNECQCERFIYDVYCLCQSLSPAVSSLQEGGGDQDGDRGERPGGLHGHTPLHDGLLVLRLSPILSAEHAGTDRKVESRK